jgi:hypothetical protein
MKIFVVGWPESGIRIRLDPHSISALGPDRVRIEILDSRNTGHVAMFYFISNSNFTVEIGPAGVDANFEGVPQVPPQKRGRFLGPAGLNVRRLTAETGVQEPVEQSRDKNMSFFKY